MSLAVPAAVALALMLWAGSFINAQHTEQEGTLLQHRLLLREWAPEVTADEALCVVPPGSVGGRPPQRRVWAVDTSVDDMLCITAKARGRTACCTDPGASFFCVLVNKSAPCLHCPSAGTHPPCRETGA